MLIAALGALSACASIPSGPSVMVLPGVNKPLEQFREDNAACQYYAQQEIGQTTPGQAATESATKSTVTGTAIGAAAGAAIGAASGNPEAGAAIGGGSGLVLGSAAGSSAARRSADAVQTHYDIAYIQCMYAKDNQVPVPAGYGGLSSRYQPPPPPPPGSKPPPPGSFSPPPASGNPGAP